MLFIIAMRFLQNQTSRKDGWNLRQNSGEIAGFKAASV